MSDPTPSGPKPITAGRVTTWIVVGGIGVFLVASGLAGIVAKG